MADNHKPDAKVRPSSDADFVEWARAHISPHFGPEFRGYCESNIASVLLAMQQHEFFAGLDAEFERWNAAEAAQTGSELLMSRQTLELTRKPFASVLNKCFRKNVVWNEDFPDPPRGGWVEPNRVFRQMTDLIRGALVCRYADGPKKLAEQLSLRAKNLGLESRYYSQGRDDGYYAYHFYVRVPADIYGFAHEPRQEQVSVEIQLTTQLQDVLRVHSGNHVL